MTPRPRWSPPTTLLRHLAGHILRHLVGAWLVLLALAAVITLSDGGLGPLADRLPELVRWIGPAAAALAGILATATLRRDGALDGMRALGARPRLLALAAVPALALTVATAVGAATARSAPHAADTPGWTWAGGAAVHPHVGPSANDETILTWHEAADGAPLLARVHGLEAKPEGWTGERAQAVVRRGAGIAVVTDPTLPLPLPMAVPPTRTSADHAMSRAIHTGLPWGALSMFALLGGLAVGAIGRPGDPIARRATLWTAMMVALQALVGLLGWAG
jgi:hypothetical protein